jgi:outer membrane protein assembly factor BamB
VEWTEKDYRWKVTLPGIGHGSPVIWDDRLFVTSGDEQTGTRWLQCRRTSDGSELWSRQFPSVTYKKHLRNSYASGTPAVDERHVYVCWGSPEEYLVVALDHQGNEAWRRDLGPFPRGHGAGQSPMVYQDLLVLANDQGTNGYLIAFDRLTGATRWKVDRRDTRTPYSTPCLFQQGGFTVLVFTDWEHGITGIDPRDGSLAWEIDVFEKDEEKRSIGSPIVTDDLVIGTCGFTAGKKFAVAVRPGKPAESGPAAVEEVYRIERFAPHIPTPLAYGGLLFLWADNGIVSCVDAATGKPRWQQRVGGNFSGSPVCAGGRLYCVAEDGEVVVLAASDRYELLARNPLGEASRGTPAVSDGTLYVRTYSQLMAVGGK